MIEKNKKALIEGLYEDLCLKIT